MKLTTTVVECKAYSIVNHVDSDYLPSVSKAAAESTPLVCDLNAGILEMREKEYEVDEELIKGFDLACQGKHPRWKLVQVMIRGCYIVLAFADLCSPTAGGEYKCQTISFQRPLTFTLYADRPGNAAPDVYTIEFYGYDLEGDRVASIQEKRNSIFHALDTIHCWNDRNYLNSYCYD